MLKRVTSPKFLKLCLVTHRQAQTFENYKDFIIQCIEGGITSVQLRDKTATQDELYQQADALKKLLAPYQIPLIINDHMEIAKAVRAEGVHLGQKDTHPEEARCRLGPDVKIGLSVESLEQLAKANQLDCIDYIAASAVFQSPTKVDCAMTWGLTGLKEVCENSIHPVVAIGGITLLNVKDVMRCGAAGIAVIGAIHQAPCPKSAAEQLISIVENGYE